MLRAGRTAKNASRYYYKCPLNEDHAGSFKWFDEWTATRNQSSHGRVSKMVNRQPIAPKRHDEVGDVHVTHSRYCRNSTNTGFASPMSIVLMAFVEGP